MDIVHFCYSYRPRASDLQGGEMEAAFSWIGQIWEFIVSLLPHLGLMRATHGGVKFKRGGRVTEIRPGLYWHWPIVTDVVSLPVKRQTLSLDVQTLTTKDDYTVSVNATIVFEVNDVRKALAETWDVDDTVGDVAQRSVLAAVCGRSFEQLREELTGCVAAEIKASCKRDMRQFGILIKDAFLSDCAVVTAYRVIGESGSVLPIESDE